MKKFFITCFYFTLALAATAASYRMPAASSFYQDQQMSAGVEYSKIEPTAFTYSSSLLDTMRLLSSNYYIVEYPLTGSSRAPKEIYQITLNAIKQLTNHGLTVFHSKEPVLGYHATLQLAISKYSNTDNSQISTDSGYPQAGNQSVDTISSSDPPDDAVETAKDSMDITSAIIWQCYVYTADGIEANFKIDDKSGKVVGFCIWSYPNALLSDTNKTSKIMDNLCAFAKDYYGLPAKIITEETASVTDAKSFKAEYETSTLYYYLELSEETSDKIHIPLQIYPDSWMLN